MSGFSVFCIASSQKVDKRVLLCCQFFERPRFFIFVFPLALPGLFFLIPVGDGVLPPPCVGRVSVRDRRVRVAAVGERVDRGASVCGWFGYRVVFREYSTRYVVWSIRAGRFEFFFRAVLSVKRRAFFFLPITMFLFSRASARGWCRVPVPFFSRIRRVIESRLFSKLLKISLGLQMSTPERGKIRKIQRGR